MTAVEKLDLSAAATERNLLELLIARVRANPGVAAQHKVNGQWTDVSWQQVLDQVRAISAGLVAQGIAPGDRVALFAATSLQWVIADLAISAARAISVPIYASNTPDEVRYILQNSESKLLFVDNDTNDGKQVGRLTRARAKLSESPTVKTVVLFEGSGNGSSEISLEQLVAKGKSESPNAFDERVAALQASDVCHFIYTSGTTGNPKGVMLTQGNWVYEAQAISAMGLMNKQGSVMLFLPLAHSFGQATKAAWVGLGFKLIFAESLEKLVANLSETKPSILPAVPRVFEKVFATVQSNATTAPGLKGKLARWSFGLFDEYVEARKQGKTYDSLGWSLAKKLVFSKIQAAVQARLGGNMQLMISGSAPLAPKIAYFFELIGLEICEGYGLTETSAGATVNRPGGVRIGTVGPAFPGSEVKIAADGEILLKGPGVMVGYYQNQQATDEVLSKDGWFASGDIGEMDKEGFVKITDRKKDIIVTAGGKNVAPQNLENLLKTHAIVSSAMVYGDKRAYLTCLICVNEENGRKLLSDQGITVGSYTELAKHPKIREVVQKAVDSVNAEQPPYNTLKKFTLMDHDFTQETGELTPTLKVKRKHCTQVYASTLDAMYAGGKE